MVVVPETLRRLRHYLKVAEEFDSRDPIVSYYVRLFAVQKGMEYDKKTPEARNCLAALLDGLESDKIKLRENDIIGNEQAAREYIEQKTMKLFAHADNEDRAKHYDRNLVRFFYTASLLFDVCEMFGELTEDMEKFRKYAKAKAAYLHNCLNRGVTPNSDETVCNELNDVNISDAVKNYSDAFASDPQQPASLNTTLTLPNVPSLETTNTVEHTNNSLETIQSAQRYCKFAMNALQYEDVQTAIVNLEKSLNLLKQL